MKTPDYGENPKGTEYINNLTAFVALKTSLLTKNASAVLLLYSNRPCYKFVVQEDSMKRLVILSLLFALLCGCVFTATTNNEIASISASTTVQTKELVAGKVPAQKSLKSNTGIEFSFVDVTGFEVPRAVAKIQMTTITGMSESEFISFSKTTIQPLLSKYAYVTLDYGDGNGLVFFRDLDTIYYGAIDDNGAITTVYHYYSIKNSSLSTWDPEPIALEPIVEEPPSTPSRQATETMVWIPTHGGTKYHKTSSCSGMKEPEQVPVSEAKARGFEPCKKCYGG